MGDPAPTSWTELARALLGRRDFWADSASGLALLGMGVSSLGYDVLTEKVSFSALFLPELVNVVAMGQSVLVALVALLNRRLLRSRAGQALLLLNLAGVVLHLKRIRTAMQAGPAYSSALRRAGVPGMKDPSRPMLSALLFPLLGFLPTLAPGVTLERQRSLAYADMDSVAPELKKWNARLPANVKMANTFLGRGRISQWLTLDVLRLTGSPGARAGSRPMLCYFHGGGWTVGDKMFAAKSSLEYLVAHADVVVFVVNYRLAPEARYPDQLHDCKRALWWARQHAADFGADPERCFAAGESAGGHLAAMLALTPNDAAFDPPDFTGDEDTSLRGVVDIYGVHDLTDSQGHHAKNEGMQPLDAVPRAGAGSNVENVVEDIAGVASEGAEVEQLRYGKPGIVRLLERVVFQTSVKLDEDAFRNNSPTHLLSMPMPIVPVPPGVGTPGDGLASDDAAVGSGTRGGGACPFLVIHGTSDSLVAVDDSRDFFKGLQGARKDAASPVRDVYVEIDDAEHGFGYLPSPRSVAMSLAIAAFMGHHSQPNADRAKL